MKRPAYRHAACGRLGCRQIIIEHKQEAARPAGNGALRGMDCGEFCQKLQFPSVMVSEDRTSPQSGRARTSRTIPTKSPLPCRIREFYRDDFALIPASCPQLAQKRRDPGDPVRRAQWPVLRAQSFEALLSLGRLRGSIASRPSFIAVWEAERPGRWALWLRNRRR